MKYTSRAHKVFAYCNVTFMCLLAIVMIFPYLNTMAIAFNEGNDSMLGGITIYPRVPTLENFRSLLGDDSILLAFIVTVLRVVAGTLLALIINFSTAYVFSKRSMFGRTPLLFFFLLPMFFGGGLIPTYLLYSELGLLNHFMVYVIPGAFAFFHMIIIRTYLYSLPESLVESAKMDGAKEVTIVLRIILPLSMPIIATIGLWTAVSHWNDWTTTLTFVTNPELYTLQYKLMQLIRESETIAQLIQEAAQRGEADFQDRFRVTPDSIRAAQVLLTTIPIIIVYPFLQKYFIKGVLIGSVKE